jgi:hypothetical protein
VLGHLLVSAHDLPDDNACITRYEIATDDTIFVANPPALVAAGPARDRCQSGTGVALARRRLGPHPDVSGIPSGRDKCRQTAEMAAIKSAVANGESLGVNMRQSKRVLGGNRTAELNDLKSERIGDTSITVTITPGAPMTELDAIREATAYRVRLHREPFTNTSTTRLACPDSVGRFLCNALLFIRHVDRKAWPMGPFFANSKKGGVGAPLPLCKESTHG